MTVRPSILCPVDFSEGSGVALRYASAIATQFNARLIVLTVEHPLLTESLDMATGVKWSPDDSRQELATFAARVFGRDSDIPATFEYDVEVGRPATEILRVARERACDLIVISTHGLTGMRKLFFGSTTERVLRETTQPVLLTPGDPEAVLPTNAKQMLRRILVPVDLSEAAGHQTEVARRLAETFDVPLLLVHVIEPVKSRLVARLHLSSLEANRRAAADNHLTDLMAMIPARLHPEALVAHGDPAEELAKVAHDRQVGLIVIGLQGSPQLGPRLGSVTYRLLCLAHTLILAIPPGPPAAGHQADSGADPVPS